VEITVFLTDGAAPDVVVSVGDDAVGVAESNENRGWLAGMVTSRIAEVVGAREFRSARSGAAAHRVRHDLAQDGRRRRAAGPVCGRVRQACAHQPFERFGYLGRQPRPGSDAPFGHGGRIGVGARPARGQTLPHQQPERVHVAGGVCGITGFLLRSHVGAGTRNEAVVVRRGIAGHGRDPEVDHLHSGRRQHHVGRLDVAVHEAARARRRGRPRRRRPGRPRPAEAGRWWRAGPAGRVRRRTRRPRTEYATPCSRRSRTPRRRWDGGAGRLPVPRPVGAGDSAGPRPRVALASSLPPVVPGRRRSHARRCTAGRPRPARPPGTGR
jgi:hypothetical protein